MSRPMVMNGCDYVLLWHFYCCRHSGPTAVCFVAVSGVTRAWHNTIPWLRDSLEWPQSIWTTWCTFFNINLPELSAYCIHTVVAIILVRGQGKDNGPSQCNVDSSGTNQSRELTDIQHLEKLWVQRSNFECFIIYSQQRLILVKYYCGEKKLFYIIKRIIFFTPTFHKYI